MNIGIKDVLQRIRLFFILYIIILCGCFIIKLIFSREDIYFAVNNRYSFFGDAVFPYITDLGNGWTIVILSAIIALFNYRKAFLMAGSWAITSLSAQLIKHLFNSPRPKLYFKDYLSNIHFVKGVNVLQYGSFPSGHTTTAFSAAVVIIYLTWNKKWSIPVLLVALLVGYSRMYLSQHFFEDVTGGSALGVFLTIFWLSWIDRKAFLHKDGWNRGLIKTIA